MNFRYDKEALGVVIEGRGYRMVEEGGGQRTNRWTLTNEAENQTIACWRSNELTALRRLAHVVVTGKFLPLTQELWKDRLEAPDYATLELLEALWKELHEGYSLCLRQEEIH